MHLALVDEGLGFVETTRYMYIHMSCSPKFCCGLYSIGKIHLLTLMERERVGKTSFLLEHKAWARKMSRVGLSVLSYSICIS